MARPRRIDREQLLDRAEAVVAAEGTAALTFGRVAAAAGLPKASVQSAFGTREALIEAMLARWLRVEAERFAHLAGPDPSPRARVLGHLRSVATETPEASTRMAALLAALTEAGLASGSLAEWYASRIGDLSAQDEEGRRLRLAFLAAEGAFSMRHLAGFPIREEVWREVFEDLERLVLGQAPETPGRPIG
ncbi:MAG TPA: TetR/AcrR family transcriptional regulator [Roseococcus sp.]|jgi:AcrR family transcriptional regulator|nr:TetR/AcrR family transcriptional regulator [Roseococcus sp.]